jgi:hypothetical protein
MVGEHPREPSRPPGNPATEALLAELHTDVDNPELARADGPDKLLAGFLQERELIGRLRTWPWAVCTLQGFDSALLLPVLSSCSGR